MRVSEARLNDLCYIVLKKSFFEPSLHASPRECDIRICMDMSAKERLTLQSAILLPDEVAGKSHDVFYDVDPGEVFDECINYLEDHWIKQEFPEEWKKAAREQWVNEMVPMMMKTPEEECGG